MKLVLVFLVSIFAVVLVSFAEETGRERRAPKLTCHCSSCKKDTCKTKGQCYMSWHGNGLTAGCIKPRDVSRVCDSPSMRVMDISCCDSDYCNRVSSEDSSDETNSRDRDSDESNSRDRDSDESNSRDSDEKNSRDRDSDESNSRDRDSDESNSRDRDSDETNSRDSDEKNSRGRDREESNSRETR
ncbi:uncharacterized protein LOC144435566 [Glandiceps talaboti]